MAPRNDPDRLENASDGTPSDGTPSDGTPSDGTRSEAQPGSGASDASTRQAGDSIRRAAEGAGDVLDEAVEVGERLASLGQSVAKRVRSTAGEAGRHIRESRAARNPRLAALARQPLPKLFDLHPEARNAPVRDLGLQTIPVAEIQGTAVEGAAQRGRDFRPLRDFRSANWRGRWQRIRSAQQGLSILPPIDVLETADGYWVIDGHNRVAAALYGGQPDIDAVVTRVRLTGEEMSDVVQGSMAALVADGDELRAAAAGQLTPGSSLEGRLRDPATYGHVAEGDTSESESAGATAEGDEPTR